VVDQDLGVFRLGPKVLLEGIVRRRIISNLLRIPDEFSAVPGDNNLLANCALSPNHQMETALSVIRATPNGRAVHHREERRFAAQGGLVEKLEIAHLAETAKFNEEGFALNSRVINKIADAEAKTAMESFRDRPTGVLTLVHDPRAVWVIRSFAQSIVFQRPTEAPPEVVLDFGERPPQPSVFNHLPQRIRNLLNRDDRPDLPAKPR
jgi:hypothetical protein